MKTTSDAKMNSTPSYSADLCTPPLADLVRRWARARAKAPGVPQVRMTVLGMGPRSRTVRTRSIGIGPRPGRTVHPPLHLGGGSGSSWAVDEAEEEALGWAQWSYHHGWIGEVGRRGAGAGGPGDSPGQSQSRPDP